MKYLMTTVIALLLALCGTCGAQEPHQITAMAPTSAVSNFASQIPKCSEAAKGQPCLVEPEPIDVPAVEREFPTGASTPVPCNPPLPKDSMIVCLKDSTELRLVCKDPSRIGPVFDGNGKGHCLKF